MTKRGRNANDKCALYRVVHTASGKDYVGITMDVARRWYEHRWDASRGSKTHFHLALAKYGADAFSWNVIAWAATFHGGCQLEQMARRLGMGVYNHTNGGEGVSPGTKLSAETRAKLSAAKKGVPKSAEHRAKIGAAHRGKGYILKAIAAAAEMRRQKRFKKEADGSF